MAVLIEGISVVLLCESIVKKLPGGVAAFMSMLPNGTLCSDGEIAALSFMSPVDVRLFAESLESHGLTRVAANLDGDFVVVDQQQGVLSPCNWIQFGKNDWENDPKQEISVCVANPTRTQQIVVPNGWSYEKSLSANFTYVDGNKIPDNLEFVRSEGNIDVLRDKDSYKEFFIKRS